MTDGVRSLLAFVGASALAWLTITLARGVAIKIGFFDHPRDYKDHGHATPYLGGAGVLSAVIVVTASMGGGSSDIAVVLALAVAIGAMATLDDWQPIRPAVRFGVQTGAALVLWAEGIGWEPFEVSALNMLITVVWITGLTNAFNLLDNIDGATATTSALAAAGIGAIALHGGVDDLAVLAWALSGACATFLIFNFSRRKKMFLGDGGSMPLGFLIGSMAMLLPSAEPQVAVLAAVPLAGVAIFDTTLVVVSRRRRGVTILTGGRDHSTHRLLAYLRTPARVCLLLALIGALSSGLAYAMHRMESGAVLVIAAAYVVVGLLMVWVFESAMQGWGARESNEGS